jgi:pimeloyl-ACP methyl ester carboxylesterase
MKLYATQYAPPIKLAQTPPDKCDQQHPIIILHGLFGSSRNWHPIAKILAEKRIVYCLDLPNHGQSPSCEQMTYQSMAQAVLDFIKTLDQQCTSVDIIGHSMGGKVAMCLALLHSEIIHKLIVVDIAPVQYEHDFSHILEALSAIPLDKIHSRAEADTVLATYLEERNLRQFLLQNLYLSQNKEGQIALLKQRRYQWRLNLDAIATSMLDVIAFPKLENSPSFAKRVLFVGGEYSDYLNKNNRDKTKQLFPKAIFTTLKKAGHWLHAEQPEHFVSLVQYHLEKVVTHET